MQLQAYRETVVKIDTIFQAMAGWSLVDAVATCTEEDLAQTCYAQPITFMVQVGLLHLLEAFGIKPHVVLGHSAGEIAALYASGHLSLEDAVRCVYVRSHEQQKMAGSGRMLAVGISKHEALRYISQNLRECPDCEIACVNSPKAVVIGGPEDQLTVLSKSLPLEVKRKLLQGNIAFHTSTMKPILEKLRKKLGFLKSHKAQKRRAEFVSTVTGSYLDDEVDAEYIIDNVRQPVQFEAAVNVLFRSDEGKEPSIVLEMGPNLTLASSFLQCMPAGKKIEVLGTLSKGKNDCRMIFELLAKCQNHGLKVNWSHLIGNHGYNFLRNLPQHPVIRLPSPGSSYFRRQGGIGLTGTYGIGPSAGNYMFAEGGPTIVEVSSKVCPQMMNHVMTGIPMLPGMYYVEAVLETLKGDSCVIHNVDFQSICAIPQKSGEKIFLSILKNCSSKGSEDFQVVSSREPYGLPDKKIHCSGSIKRINLIDHNGSIVPNLHIEGEYGLLEDNVLRDIGSQGMWVVSAFPGASVRSFFIHHYSYDLWYFRIGKLKGSVFCGCRYIPRGCLFKD
jgi:acyl transferase domain-containing protein